MDISAPAMFTCYIKVQHLGNNSDSIFKYSTFVQLSDLRSTQLTSWFPPRSALSTCERSTKKEVVAD